MDIVGNLAIIFTICTSIMAPAALVDNLITEDAKETIFSRFKSRKFGLLRNRDVFLKILNSLFQSKVLTRQIGDKYFDFSLPSKSRFLLLHFVLVSVVALIIVPGSEPIFHEAHRNAEVTGWVVGGYQFHTWVFREWISLYLSTLLLSAPFDYLSAVKSLSLAAWAHGKSVKYKLCAILADLFGTLALVAMSLSLLWVFTLIGLNIPETLFRILGATDDWLIHTPLTGRLINAVLVMVYVTGLVLIIAISLHIASVLWFFLSWGRILRIFAIRYLRVQSHPFSVAGLSFCVLIVPIFIFLSWIS